MSVFPCNASQDRARKFFVNLGVTRYRFLTLAIGSDIMSPAMA